jgi:hypothetical protein
MRTGHTLQSPDFVVCHGAKTFVVSLCAIGTYNRAAATETAAAAKRNPGAIELNMSDSHPAYTESVLSYPAHTIIKDNQ